MFRFRPTRRAWLCSLFSVLILMSCRAPVTVRAQDPVAQPSASNAASPEAAPQQGESQPAASQQPPPAEAASPSPTDTLKRQVEQLQSQLEAVTDLEDPVRKQIQDALAQATKELGVAVEHDTQTRSLAEKAASLEAEQVSLATRIAELKEQPEPQIGDKDTLPELEQRLAEARRELAELQNQFTTQAVDPKARAAERKTLRESIFANPQELAAVAEQLQAAPPANEVPLLTQARQVALQAARLALERKPLAAQARLSLMDSEEALEIANLRRDELAMRIAYREKLIRRLEAETARLRQAEAEMRRRSAEDELESVVPPLRALVESTLAYAREEEDIREKRQDYQKKLEDRVKRKEEVAKLAQQARDREDQVRLTTALGLRLRQQREELPETRGISRDRADRLADLEDAQLNFLDRADKYEDLRDTDAVVEKLLGASSPDGTVDPLAEEARRLVEQQRQFLGELVDAYDDYTETLYQLDSEEQALIEEVNGFASYIDERILWIRSHRPLSLETLEGDKLAVLWLIDGRFWRSVWRSLYDDARLNLPEYAIFFFGWLLLLLRGRWLRKRLADVSRTAENRINCEFRPTLLAWWLTALISLPWPLLFMYLGWRCKAAASPDSVNTLGTGLLALGGAILATEFFRQMCRGHGLAQSHFGWSDHTVDLIRSTLRGIMFFAVPLAVLVLWLHARDTGQGTDALERLAFLAVLIVLLIYSHRALRPGSGILRDWAAYRPSGLLSRSRGLIYVLILGLFVGLGVLAVLGYYYTAQRMLEKFQVLLWMLASVVFARAMLIRWLMLRRRRLSLQQARERRAALSEQVESGSTAPMPDVAETQTDLGAVSAQTQRLIDTTLFVLTLAATWAICVDVLPALNYLDQYSFGTTSSTVIEQVQGADGSYETVEKVVVRNLTLASLLKAILIGVMTFTAARNVPGLMEITLLQKLPLDASVRYATAALTRYLIVLLGVILTARSLGIGWSQVQWLAAALTFGLGFGLQEIFANFISGLIILFEQPIRVGDVVTLDSTSGVVNRIRIRATTITDWDRKEYIVPNKEFITGRLLNWTLSDKTNRIVVNVGVKYGSDTDKVREVITGVVADHPEILEDPAPLVTFEGFGDSALNFVVRAYLPTLDRRLATIHDLHTEIHRRLGAEGIEIPFPQRDLHVRSMVDINQQFLPQNGPPQGGNGRNVEPESTSAETI
ncbi:Miniconductance mechanosensitive channel MscM precursor [Maioricimonas rarisocia]|uniref:Miniconductance mechanosensitive channel MscM n=1 Tax=Maioricimonas rarisocia TaxID=2528026 RepID=A0A517ZF34_9PLAN|nr:Miniconductance mechanosensitive channel MscM precursor [Maioricimonas rarisocia]